ncbi:Putative UPF0481 protein [Apostasia shenzhenica]|uniref:UPF0481 protein n=1 Tax=Apostasia shenzhenica TaxID=1088818 RepID=A0A2I0BCJ1_9ASPA|nr:Putative UPF0481 protein [Apostasia shenzhenica]
MASSSTDFLLPMLYLNQSQSSFDEQRWLSLVRRACAVERKEAEEDEEEAKAEVAVFFVPRNLIALKPQAYIPQLFAFGPYHHWQPNLYDMERYKLAAARKVQAELRDLNLEDLVGSFMKHEQRIRSYYHKHLDFTGETLVWMMVIDASFLLEFLRSFSAEAQKRSPKQRMDAGRLKAAIDFVTRDSMMLENQIPLFLLRKMLRRRHQCSPEKFAAADGELSDMLLTVVKEVIPFKQMASSISFIDSKKYAHLLQLLYCIIVSSATELEEINPAESDCLIDMVDPKEETAVDQGCVRRVFDSVWNYASSVNDGAAIQAIKRFFIAGPIKFIMKVPWKILSNFPGIESLLHHGDAKEGKGDGEEESKNKLPLVEEITVPSVTELAGAGVSFAPSNGDLTTIRFEIQQNKKATLYLPTVSLDENTEVVLRNLVAYETSAVAGPTIFARYTELMNGIIDSEEDVKLLRQKGIVVNRMKSDQEVADLWNGMSRSSRVSKVTLMDRTLEEVNGYYNRRWNVRTMIFVKKYLFGSWQLLTLLGAMLLLLLTCLQAFCSVYSCGDRWFVATTDGGQKGT